MWNQTKRQLTSVAVMTLCVCAGHALAVPQAVAGEQEAHVHAPNEDLGLPTFDIRVSADGTPAPQVMAALGNQPKGAEHAAALKRLAAAVEFVTVDEDQFFGTPRFVQSWKQLLTPPTPPDQKATPTDVVSGFIANYRALFEIDPAEVPAAKVTRNYTDTHNGVTHLTFQQQIKGIDIFGASIKANVTAEGELINISSTMLPRPGGDFSVPGGGLSDLEAISAGAASVGVTMTEAISPVEEPQGPSQKRKWNNTADFDDWQPITTYRVYFPVTRDDIRAAWWVVIPTRGVGHTYELVIDASDGTILHRVNELHFEPGSATMLVRTSRSPHPGWTPFCNTINESRKLVTVNPSDPGVSLASPYGWLDTNGVAGADSTQTVGNNFDCRLDIDGDNVVEPGERAEGGPTYTFSFVQNLTQNTTLSPDAALTQAFYYSNIFHDRMYALGFTEAAGNYQTNNYGRGGLGNDPVIVDVLDIGQNGANFSITADGTSGRCQLDAGTTRDEALDCDLVYHELAHGLSHRLTGVLYGNVQSSGMGEGWSDFFGLCLTTSANENPAGNFPYYTYSFGLSCTGNGGHFFPYSTNMTVAPWDWDFYGTSGTTSYGLARATFVHDTGTIWTSALWDIRGGLYDVYGFAANDLVMQLVVDGLKLQPDSPSFVQARDAIIAADLANYGGANQRVIWTAFAKRGLGQGADSGASTSTAQVIMSSTVPASDSGFAERADIGEMPASAQTIYGSSAPTRITGGLGAAGDMFRITICDASNFSATTVGGPSGYNNSNTQLFLFDLAGNGVAFNDDSGATLQATLNSTLLSAPGDYYLAVCGAGRDPVSSTGAIWLDTPTTTQRAPDGPGAGNPITGWTGTAVGGKYSIQLTGVCATVRPAAAKTLRAWGSPNPHVVTPTCTPTSTSVNFQVYVASATLPASSGVTVSLDASSIGLGTQTLTGAGAGNATFSKTVTVGPLPAGDYFLPYHVTDAQGRSFDNAVLYTVSDPVRECCLPGGGCTTLTACACAAQGGTWLSTTTTCETGACCVAGNCVQTLYCSCVAQGGTWLGVGAACDNPCPTFIETEPNDTTATANDAGRSFRPYAASLFQMGFTGSISPVTDMDFVAVGAMQAGDILTLSESGSPSGAGTLTDPLCRLRRSGTSLTVAEDSSGGPGADSLIWRFPIATAANYFIWPARDGATATGTYRLGALLENADASPSTGSSFTAETEPNDTIATANNAISAWRPVSYDSTSYGYSDAGGFDFFSYTFTAGDVITARVFAQAPLDARTDLYGPSGNLITFEDGSSTGPGADSAIVAYVIPTTGTYYVRVSGPGSNNYSLTVYLSTYTPPPGNCSADFDNDGDTGTDMDIEAFFACLGGNCCATCASADFDGDGDTGTDLDIEAFFRVLGGGSC